MLPMLWILEAAGCGAGEGVNSSFFWSKFVPAALNVICAGELVDGLVWCVGGREELLSVFRIRIHLVRISGSGSSSRIPRSMTRR